MKWLFRIAVLTVVLVLARTALGLVVSKAHYDSTPTFREWVQTRAVAGEPWRRSVPLGEELANRLPWSTAGPEHAAEERADARVWSPHLRIKHGEELLLEIELEVVFDTIANREPKAIEALPKAFETPTEAFETPTEATGGFEALFEALTVRARTSFVDPEFHAVVVLSVAEPPVAAAGTLGLRPGALFPSVRVDAFALAGPGELEFIVQSWPTGTSPTADVELFGEGSFASFGWDWVGRILFGLPCSLEGPPAKGLVYTLGVACYAGNGLGNWTLRGSSEQYSIELLGEQSLKKPGGSLTKSVNRHVNWTWQEQTW